MIQIVFLQKYSKKELFIIVGATIPIMIAVVLSGNNTIMSAWMFVVAAKEIEFDSANGTDTIEEIIGENRNPDIF